MASLKNNGAQVLRVTWGSLGDERIMSNGKVLRKRGGNGGFRVIGKIKPGLTFAEVRDIYARSDQMVVEVTAPEWLDLKPAPTKLIRETGHDGRTRVRSRNPGYLRAKVAQSKEA